MSDPESEKILILESQIKAQEMEIRNLESDLKWKNRVLYFVAFVGFYHGAIFLLSLVFQN